MTKIKDLSTCSRDKLHLSSSPVLTSLLGPIVSKIIEFESSRLSFFDILRLNNHSTLKHVMFVKQRLAIKKYKVLNVKHSNRIVTMMKNHRHRKLMDMLMAKKAVLKKMPKNSTSMKTMKSHRNTWLLNKN